MEVVHVGEDLVVLDLGCRVKMVWYFCVWVCVGVEQGCAGMGTGGGGVCEDEISIQLAIEKE